MRGRSLTGVRRSSVFEPGAGLHSGHRRRWTICIIQLRLGRSRSNYLPSIRIQDLEQCSCIFIPRRRGPGKGIPKASPGIWYLLDLSAENNPTGDHDKEKNDNLDQAKNVHESDTDDRGKSMYARNDDNHRKCDPPFFPLGCCVIRRNQDVLCEDNTAGC